MTADADRLLAELTEPSQFTQHGLHRPLFDQLHRRIPAHHLRRLGSLVFVLLKPDAVVSGKVPRALDHLERNGLEIVDVAPCFQTSLRQFEELYKYNLANYTAQDRPASWWLNGQLFQHGPVVTLLVRAPPPGSAHARVAALKGPSNPYRGEPGQLRHELGACNRAINLIHAADDPLSTARELLIFHPLEHLAHHLAHEPAPLAPWRDRFALTVAAVAQASQPIDVIASLVALKLKLRVLAGATASDDITRALLELAADPAAPRRRMQRYRTLCQHERAALGPPTTPWHHALVELAEFDAYRLEVAQRLFARLAAEGVAFTAWDKLIVETTMHYLDDFTHLEPSDRCADAT